MIRASELYGRVLVDLDSAEKVGNIDEIIVDPYAPCIAGYVVTTSHRLLGRGQRMLVASESVHAIGPDALTVRHAGSDGDLSAHLDSLPRLSELTGRRMVSHGGRLLGTIEDALIDERDSRIIGYPLDGGAVAAGLERLFALGMRSDRLEYVRADADLRVGAKLVVVPDDAVVAVDNEQLQAPPDISLDVPDAPANAEAPAERKRRPASGRRSTMAVPIAPPAESPPAEAALAEAAMTPLPVDELSMDHDLDDTTPLTVPGRTRRHQVSSVG
jgi:sporulation protein YlmC with PRC-barrel domain